MSMTEETERSKENKEEAGKTTKTPNYKYLTHSEYQAFLNEEHEGNNLVNFQAKVVRYLPEGKTKEEYDRLLEEEKADDYAKLTCQHLVYLTSDKKYHPVIKAQNGEGIKLDNVIERIFFHVINPKVGIDIVKRKSGTYNLRQLSLENETPTIPSKHHKYGISRRQLILPKDKATLESIKQGIDKIIEETQPLPDATKLVKDVVPETQDQIEEKIEALEKVVA